MEVAQADDLVISALALPWDARTRSARQWQPDAGVNSWISEGSKSWISLLCNVVSINTRLPRRRVIWWKTSIARSSEIIFKIHHEHQRGRRLALLVLDENISQ